MQLALVTLMAVGEGVGVRELSCWMDMRVGAGWWCGTQPCNPGVPRLLSSATASQSSSQPRPAANLPPPPHPTQPKQASKWRPLVGPPPAFSSAHVAAEELADEETMKLEAAAADNLSDTAGEARARRLA